MFDTIDENEQHPTRSPKPGTWAAMNWIQRPGVLALLPFYMLSLFWSGQTGAIFAMIAWSTIFLGYVAGNLWRYRHALHFWWSIAFACAVHLVLLPTYIHLTELSRNAEHQTGKSYMYLSFGVLIAEVLCLLFVLKRTGMWIHRRLHPSWPEHRTS